LLPKPAKRGRPRTDLRQVLAAIFYVVKGGILWQSLPTCLLPWQSFYGIFRRWKRNHCSAALDDALRIVNRKTQGKRGQPAIDEWESGKIYFNMENKTQPSV
jgi:putative transposase